VAAIAFFSTFLWVGVRLIVRGFSLLRFSILILLAVLCFYTKSTVMIAVGLAVLPILSALAGRGKKRYAWAAAGFLIVGLVLVLDFGYPRNWYPEGGTPASLQVENSQAVVGGRAFIFNSSSDSAPSRASQLIPANEDHQSETQTYTVGAWIWADRPGTVQTPTLHFTTHNASRQVEVDQQPRYFAFSEEVGAEERAYKISLIPTAKTVSEEITVYYDGILLIEGDWEGETPTLDDPSGSSVTVAGRSLNNLVRNASGETPGFRLRGWVEAVLLKAIPGNPNLVIGLIQDPAPLVSYYMTTMRSLFHTFWARFGWAQVFITGYRPYTLLGLFTLAGLAGAGAAFWSHRKQVRWDIILFLGSAMITVWAAALLRGVTALMDGGYFIPVARYAYPVIIPTMLVLNIGWLKIARLLEEYTRLPRRYLLWGLLAVFLLLDVLSIYSILAFFRG
jgi:hypothetical protein